jgi:hypothetical protein
MSTRLEAFCNITTNLITIEPNIENFDRKRLIQNFAVHSGSVYAAHNSGFVSQAYVEGKEMSMVSSLSDVDSSDEAFYDASADCLYVFSLVDPDNVVYEASEDWATLKQRVVNEQADFIRSYIDRPIFERKKSEDQGASSRNYDMILINANAALACSALMYPEDPERARDLYERYISPEGDGILDRLKRGDFHLWHEATEEKNEGRVTEVSVNANTTGGILDTRMRYLPSTDFDDVRVKITAGGTFAAGTASTVTYSVFVKNDDGLAMQEVVQSEKINGDYQTMAYGVDIKFGEGVYTTDDTYSVIVIGQAEEHGPVKSEQISRR